jgi:hypothetical protein
MDGLPSVEVKMKNWTIMAIVQTRCSIARSSFLVLFNENINTGQQIKPKKQR